MSNDQESDTPRGRVLHVTVSEDRGRVWFACNVGLHNEPVDPVLTPDPSTLDQLKSIHSERLRSLLGKALEGDDYTKIAVRCYKEEGDDRTRVVFYLKDAASPVALLNLMRRAFNEIEITDEKASTLGENWVLSQIRKYAQRFLFGQPGPTPKQKPKPR